MAYSELVKDFNHIRGSMREFYLYGFRTRAEFGVGSARSYDNERRRAESWLGDVMSFRQDATGRRFSLSMDSREVRLNPLLRTFTAKSFTKNDVTLHFYLLDLLPPGAEKTTNALLSACNLMAGSGLDFEVDLSTLTKKLREYEALGMLERVRKGRTIYWRRSEHKVPMERWALPLAWATEALPLGAVGSFLLTQYDIPMPEWMGFKHHHVHHTLDSEVLLQLLQALHRRLPVALFCTVPRDLPVWKGLLLPLQIYVNHWNGRMYLAAWDLAADRAVFQRLDRIQEVRYAPAAEEADWLAARERLEELKAHMWGVSLPPCLPPRPYRLEMTLRVGWRTYLLERLERERRCGRVEPAGEGCWRFTADLYDPREAMPWLRTFTGFIEELYCDAPGFMEKWNRDLYDTLNRYRPIRLAIPQQQSSPAYGSRDDEPQLPPDGTRKADCGLFHEVYCTYYRALEQVVRQAQLAPVTGRQLDEILNRCAFRESWQIIKPALQDGTWPLLDAKNRTPLQHPPQMPLTTLERRWLKATLLDPRVQLFLPPFTDLDGVEPLFRPEDFYAVDACWDGDPYDSAEYRRPFVAVLRAMREGAYLELEFQSRGGKTVHLDAAWPEKLEYSERDDKFRLVLLHRNQRMVVRMATVTTCRVVEAGSPPQPVLPGNKRVLELRLTDKNQSLERFMMEFAHLRRECRRLDEVHYQISLWIEPMDEAETLIHLLSYGPHLRLLSPLDSVQRLYERLLAQADEEGYKAYCEELECAAFPEMFE